MVITNEKFRQQYRDFGERLRAYAGEGGAADGTYNYTRFDYQDRTFNAVAPGIVLMKGKAIVGLTRRSGEKIVLDLNYLGIWRLEQGKWRFLAWQAARNTPATVIPQE